MRTTLVAIAALSFVAMLLTAGMSGVVSAAPISNDPMDRIRLETGHTKDWNGGDYVAVNMTKDGSAAWFGVVYGTEDHPAPITLVGITLRYLGGAQVVGPNGNVIADHVPIPVVTVFAQSLLAIFEFDDTGFPTAFGNYGADNGVFDFSPAGMLFSGVQQSEPVYKYVDLNRSWSRSAITTQTDAANSSKIYEFSIYATNVTYSKVWDPQLHAFRNGTADDGTVGKIEFVFHIKATAEAVTVEVPTYRVTLDNGQITDSQAIAPRNYTGVSASADIKYDHIVEGWDPYPNATNPHIMLENVLAFGVLVPHIVEEWYNVQFVKNHIEDGSGVVSYTTDRGDVQARGNDDVQRNSTLLKENSIEFTDNWERCGALTWVSNVTVDGQERQAYYQVHAGLALNVLSPGELGARAMLVFILGGYIYPVGQSVVHDPSFFAQALQVDDNSLKALFVVLLIGIAVVCIATLAGLFMLRKANRRGRDELRYRPPPGYR